MNRRNIAAATLSLALLATACAGSADATAIEIIEGELSDQLGFSMVGACDELQESGNDESFSCTGTTEENEVVTFVANFDAEANSVDMHTTNVANTDLIAPALEESLLENALILGDDPIDCGTGFVILDDMQMTCVLTLGDETHETAVLTFLDTQTGDFDWVIE